MVSRRDVAAVAEMAPPFRWFYATDNQRQKEEAMKGLVAVIESMRRTKIVTMTDDYLHVEFRSLVFRFVDDVEFYFDDRGKTIHLRSASRVGHSDLGVNRKRVERIREVFDAAVEK